ncbi:MAG: ABC transporter permease [Bacteroidales bacterium]|nr:MAG: ABC transporter permease [Bacteroidales bacterium]
MLYHNLLLIFRNFLRSKTSFLINLIGLSTSLACVLLIYLWVSDELNIDTFHDKDNQLYKVWCNRIKPNGVVQTQGASSNLAQALKDEMPEVEYAVAVNYMTISRDGGNGLLSDGNNSINVKGQFAGKDYFHLFSYPLIHGDKSTVLTNKSGIVITEGLAQKLFHKTENVIGKVLKWKHDAFEGEYQVSGICQDPPSNSTVQFDVIFNYDVLLEHEPNAKEWSGSYAETYVILSKGTDVEQFNSKIKDFLKSKDEKNKGKTLFLQQYSKNYLFDKFENGVQVGGRITYVRLFSIIALFILIIACINFMNLSTARASRRVKEVGVKKTLGSSRKALIIQFLQESMLMTLLSLFLALMMVELILPQFNTVIGKHLSFNFDMQVILSLMGVVILTGFISGSYPALYLSSFSPMTVLKGRFNHSVSELWTRKGLVIFQFIISVIFIVVFIVVYNQLNYLQTKNLGYVSDNIIFFQRKGDISDFNAFITELKKIPGVEKASSMTNSFLKITNSSRLNSWKGMLPSENKTIIMYPSFNYDLVEILGLKMKEGRSFSHEYQNEDSKVLLNEAAAKMMGFKEPIGEIIDIDNKKKEVIGVLRNFHFEPLHKNIEPLAVRFSQNGTYVYVKLKSEEESITIERIKKLYKEFHQFPFEFSFLTDAGKAKYEAEIRLTFLATYASVISIIISCLGLFGLVNFTVERRRKEIGIRKVMGASSSNITYLISGDFTKLVFVSILAALPLSYIVVRHWLNSFAYRIDLEWWYFIGVGFIALFIVWLTVGTQVIKAANTNPSECLAEE